MTRRAAIRPFVLLAAATVLAAAPARAQQLDVKLGLWEVHSTMQMSGPPPVDTSKMTPEQKARVDAMLAQMGAGGKPQVHDTKSCLTQAKLDKDLFEDESKDRCQRTIVAATRSVHEVKLVCTGDKEKTTMNVRFDAINSENVKGTVTGTVENSGKITNINSTVTAKWLSSQCGDVK